MTNIIPQSLSHSPASLAKVRCKHLLPVHPSILGTNVHRAFHAHNTPLPKRLPNSCKVAEKLPDVLANLKSSYTSYEDVYVPSSVPENPLLQQIDLLHTLQTKLASASTLSKKVDILTKHQLVSDFLLDSRHAAVPPLLTKLTLQEQYVLLCLPAIGQPHVLYSGQAAGHVAPAPSFDSLRSLAASLQRVEQFYDSVGGIIGYQLKSLELIAAGSASSSQGHDPAGNTRTALELIAQGPRVQYHVPRGLNLTAEGTAEHAQAAALHGLLNMPSMAEIYPVGGAGDRLGLKDELTGESLPAAMLPYCGRPIFEALIRDLQAREYLYYQVTGRQVTTPVAVMTSDAKGNHNRITQLLESLGWCGRGADSFRLFRQPLVPVLSVSDGQWLLSEPLKPLMKPGGHGAIWKLMWDEGLFDWLDEQGCKAALVRQISNPLAGTDTTLLALAGAGQQGQHTFGFMSCERAVGATEGMNVLQERTVWQQQPDGTGRWVYQYGLTNVEYTEFARLGINDEAVGNGSTTSVFPANTNVLYVSLKAAHGVVQQAIRSGNSEQLLPGLIFNLNKAVDYTCPLTGTQQALRAGRMECTMQNMADYLANTYDEPQDPNQIADKLSTFLVFNARNKVTSSAKKKRVPGSTKIHQTPDGSFRDLVRNGLTLLRSCGFDPLPDCGSVERYLSQGPSAIVLMHPAIGPLWDVVRQKIRGGSLQEGSELVLEVAEVDIQSLHVCGSLLVHATNVMGHYEQRDADGRCECNSSKVFTDIQAVNSSAGSTNGGAKLCYSSRVGRVQLVNVTVENAGVDWQCKENVYWKHQVARKEACRIVLEGNAEFEAHNVTITGDHSFVVPDGHRLVLTPAPDGSFRQTLIPLAESGPTWRWVYDLDAEGVSLQLRYESRTTEGTAAAAAMPVSVAAAS